MGIRYGFNYHTDENISNLAMTIMQKANALKPDYLEIDGLDNKFYTNDELFMKVAPDVNFSKNKKMAQKLQYVMVAKYGYEKRQKRINGERKWGYEKCH